MQVIDQIWAPKSYLRVESFDFPSLGNFISTLEKIALITQLRRYAITYMIMEIKEKK